MTFVSFAKAERFSSTIHSISFGTNNGPHLVRFDNSRVGFIQHDDVKMTIALEATHKSGEEIEVELNHENQLVSALNRGPGNHEDDEGFVMSDHNSFTPTVVSSWNAAATVFRRMRRDYTSKGECFNRAHIWSYEEHRLSNFNSMKVFMFFTDRYIRKYNFHWWFHVTPMTYVQSLRSPRVLDRRYTSQPIQTKTWSDIFIRSKLQCRKVEKFDDYFLNQRSQDCYHIHTSMYYVVPRDIERRDLTGSEKTEWVERQIQRAYKDGFNR
jgi:hypothetical protein